jgi:hypothetical protein
MNINTGKLGSSTNILFNKIKENEKKVSETNESGLKQKLLNDFADIKFIESNFKTRIINNNTRLSNYENEQSKIQYINQRLDLIENELNAKASKDSIKKIIDDSNYNNQNVLKEYFKNSDNFKTAFNSAKSAIAEKQTDLDKEFKKIEIASQNIISLNSQFQNSNIDSIKNFKNENLSDSTSLNNKRVMQLIS